jgi:hypothetical protein
VAHGHPGLSRLLAGTIAIAAMTGLLWLGPEGAAQADPSAADAGGVGIRLLDVPVEQQDDPRARSYLVDEVAPGGRIERRVQVVNSSGDDQHVYLYAGPAEISGGAFTVDGVDALDISSWIAPAIGEVDLEAGGTSDVPVAITVPADAPEGEYYAGIWAEVRSPGAKESVTLANRVGVRVYLTVGPGNGPPPDFAIDGISAERGADGVPVLTATVSNTGTTAVDLGGTARLDAASGGVSAGPFPTGTLTLGPGQQGTVHVPTDAAIADGDWTATISLTSGLVTREATGDVSIAGGTDAAAPAPAAADGFPTILLIVLLVLVVLVGAVTVILLLRRRSPRGD